MSATLLAPSPARAPGSLLSRFPAVLGAPLSFVRGARSRRRREALERDFSAARLALGKKMFAVGIDDGETSAQIAALDPDLLTATLAGPSRELLETQREHLFLRLADAALEDDAPLPGADAEFAHAVDCKSALATATAVATA